MNFQHISHQWEVRSLQGITCLSTYKGKGLKGSFALSIQSSLVPRYFATAKESWPWGSTKDGTTKEQRELVLLMMSLCYCTSPELYIMWDKQNTYLSNYYRMFSYWQPNAFNLCRVICLYVSIIFRMTKTYIKLFKFWELFQRDQFIQDLYALKWMNLKKKLYYMKNCLFQHYL